MCVNLFYAQQVEPESKSESEFVLTDNSQKENPEKNFVFTNENLNAENTIKKTSSVWLFIRMILVLGVVVVCIYFVMNFMKKSVTGDSDSGDVYLRKVAQITLSPGKTVQKRKDLLF